MIRKSVVALLAASILLSACEEIQGWVNGEPTGTSGSKTTGSLTGSQLGPMANAGDRKQIADAEQRAYTAPIGQQVTWNNTTSGDSGTITAIKDGYSPKGAYCRQFQQTMTVGGQQKQAYGTSCQQPDGTWKIVNQQ